MDAMQVMTRDGKRYVFEWDGAEWHWSLDGIDSRWVTEGHLHATLDELFDARRALARVYRDRLEPDKILINVESHFKGRPMPKVAP